MRPRLAEKLIERFSRILPARAAASLASIPSLAFPVGFGIEEHNQAPDYEQQRENVSNATDNNAWRPTFVADLTRPVDQFLECLLSLNLIS